MTTYFGAMDLEISPAGVRALALARVDAGDFRGGTIISGALLVVVSAHGSPQWVQTIQDPRTVHTEVIEGMTASTSFNFPGEFIASEAVLGSSRFDFYRTDPSAPLTTKVLVENIQVLSGGDPPIGSVSGAELTALLF